MTEVEKREYKASDIKWVKNIGYPDKSDWAYNPMEGRLHWANKINAEKADVGDIILLFQRPAIEVGNKNKHDTCLTHLVSPISTGYGAAGYDADNKGFEWFREVEVVASANPIHMIPNKELFDFRRVRSGKAHSIDFLDEHMGLDPRSTSEKQDLIWDLFKDYIHPLTSYELDGLNPELTLGLDTFGSGSGVTEGDTKVVEHIRLEWSNRNAGIVRQAKDLASREGRLRCECCDFDFSKIYGPIGQGFIECHHKKAIAEGVRITTLEDLALVCSNCHRMLHRKRADETYFTVEELREYLLS